MIIEERLKKLRWLSGRVKGDWIDWIFPIIKYGRNWWKFDENGITKENLKNANRFWNKLYNVYKKDQISQIFSRTDYDEVIEIIKELEGQTLINKSEDIDSYTKERITNGIATEINKQIINNLGK